VGRISTGLDKTGQRKLDLGLLFLELDLLDTQHAREKINCMARSVGNPCNEFTLKTK
jgi:hypothetical protein